MASTNVATLAIQIQSLQVAQASANLNNLSSASGKAERATDGLTSTFGKLLGPLTAAVSVMGALNKLVSVQREFDVLNAGLVTATGSADKAAIAFEALEEFAARTPYGLQQATEGFTKLVNLGLTPSERALTSYGNTASAMGKDLMQLVEAVADATTGEFERLKEFGIKAKQEGDKVSFTFRGVTTTIGKNATEIENYLMALGENEFAGAMEQRAASLDGALSELGDTWDGLFRAINSRDVGGAIEGSVRFAISALEGLTDLIKSGQIDAAIQSQTQQWALWGSDVSRTVDIVWQAFSELYTGLDDDTSKLVAAIIQTFTGMPTNIRALVQVLTVEFASGIDRMIADAQHWKEMIAAIFTDDTLASAMQRHGERIRAIQNARAESITGIMMERDTALNASDAQIGSIGKLGEAYRKLQADKAAANKGTDRLAGFKVGADTKGSASESKEAKDAAKKRADEFKSVVEGLRTEEEAIQDSYLKRRAIIERDTKAESDQRKDLMQRLEKERGESLTKLAEERGSELTKLQESLRSEEQVIQDSYQRRLEIVMANTPDGSAQQADMASRLAKERETALAGLEAQKQAERDKLYASLLTEEEMLRQSYERKRTAILESESVTELERQDLLRRLKTQFDQEMANMEAQRTQQQLSSVGAMFGGMADLAKTFGGEQSKAYKGLFAISKAFSVAQATMSIATGLAKAQELGFPANLAEMARVAATGASVLASVRSSNFSGAYDEGGRIPSGMVGLVGEYGPEFIQGPATVTSRKDTAKMAREAMNGGNSGRGVTMNNTFVLNDQAQVDSFRSSQRQLDSAMSRSLRRSSY